MTRQFLRDKNGEEEEAFGPDSEYYVHDAFCTAVGSNETGWYLIHVVRKEVWINQKLEFIVWEEV